MATFAERAALLDQLGIKYHRGEEWRGEPPNRGPQPIDVFEGVLLPLSPVEWMSVAMRDGDHYLGGCCGAMSALQDEIEHVFRFESGWAKCRDLARMASIIENHDEIGEKVPWNDLPTPIEDLVKALGLGTSGLAFDPLTPWEKIALCWHLVREHYSPEVPCAVHKNVTPLDGAIRILARSLEYFSLGHFFVPEGQDSEKTQIEASKLIVLARLLPALKTLNEHIGELGVEPIEGFALVDRERGPDAVCSNGYGYCILATRAEADELFRLWTKQAEQYEDDDRKKHLHDHIGIRPVRVTREKGIEFLD